MSDKPSLEQQFLPAVLEITETPPSPLGRATMYAIIGVFCFALLLSLICKVDIIAIASGKIISSGHNKLIQPLKSGVVADIFVRDGQAVKKGDPLVQIKFEDAEVNRIRLERELLFASMDVARLTALLAENPLKSFAPPSSASEELKSKNRILLKNETDKIRTQLAVIDEQIVQAEAEKETAQASIKKIERLLPNVRFRVDQYRDIYEKGSIAKSFFLEKEKELIQYEEDLNVQRNTLAEIKAKLQVLATQKKQEKLNFKNDVLYRLQEASNKEKLLKDEYANAQWIDGLTTIKAPEDGMIQEMEIHTVGGVVTPAQTLMKLVPSDSVLEIEAMVLNKDVGFVEEGQDVSIKVDSFPYTRYGTIDGKLVHLSRDAVENEQLGLIYIARISMSRDTVRVEDKDVRLSAGMSVSAEIKTGRRRLMEIILTPFMEYASESLRER